MSEENNILINCSFLFYQFGIDGSKYLEKQRFCAKVDSLSSQNLVKLKEVM